MNVALRWLPLVALTLLGCDARDAGVGVDVDTDAAAVQGDGGGWGDAGRPPGSDAGLHTQPFPGDYGARADAEDGTALCFDGVDNDGNSIFDCADRSCQENIPSCCVNELSDVCCVAPVARTLVLEGCEGDVARCASFDELEVFGVDAPRIDLYDLQPAFVPGGGRSDSGIAFPAVHDARRERLRIDAYAILPSSAAPVGSLDLVGAAFVDAETDLTSLTAVVPLVGFVLARNRREILLVVADETVARFVLPDDALEGAEVGYRITLTVGPDARAELSFQGEHSAEVTRVAVDAPLDRPLRAVAYGRSLNPTSSVRPVRLTELGVSAGPCDVPHALSRDPGGVTLAETSWAAGEALSDPFVITFEAPPGTTVEKAALMVGGDIYLADATPDGLVPTSALGTPALIVPSADWALGGVDDPALDFDDALHLYFIAYDVTGRGSVARAAEVASSGRFEEAVRVPGLYGGAESFEAVAPFRFQGGLYVVVRVADADGHRLAMYSMVDGVAGNAVSLRAPARDDLFAFDRDEVDAPAVLADGGLARLYFAGRRGSRWSIGALVSSDLTYWRAPVDGPVLRGAGTGFDAMCVRDPAVRLDAAGERLELYYTGSAGGLSRIGRATQPAPR